MKLYDKKPIFWIDNFSHDLIASGELADMIEKDNITGLTSNPTILAQAIKKDEYYKQKLFTLSRLLKPAKYDELVFPDIIQACDLFLPIYEKSHHHTGFVSLELDPKYTFDIQASIKSACDIWNTIDKPNLMIKVPASSEGIAVMEELIKLGINVNVTLIFNIQQVKNVWQAYINAIQYRAERNLPLNIRSVASFFISRLDNVVDTILTKESDQGIIASNLALVAYSEFQKLFTQSTWKALEEKGAMPQTLLWASVGVKNPLYSSDKYLQELYLDDVVFTIPPNLLKSNRSITTVSDKQIKDAYSKMDHIDSELKTHHHNIKELTQKLFDDGVKSFQKSFSELLEML